MNIFRSKSCRRVQVEEHGKTNLGRWSEIEGSTLACATTTTGSFGGTKIAAIKKAAKKRPPGSFATVADALKAESKFAAARQGLPTLEDSGAALKLELDRTTGATDASVESIMSASRECACSLALGLAPETPEEAPRVGALRRRLRVVQGAVAD